MAHQHGWPFRMALMQQLLIVAGCQMCRTVRHIPGIYSYLRISVHWDKYTMLGTISFLLTPKPSIVFELSGSGNAASKPSLQSISCRDWWLARLLILCKQKHLAIDYLSSGIEVVSEGLNPTEAPNIVWLGRLGEVAMICPVLFSGYAIETLFPQCTDVDKNLYIVSLCCTRLFLLLEYQRSIIDDWKSWKAIHQAEFIRPTLPSWDGDKLS